MPVEAIIIDDSATAQTYIQYQLAQLGCVIAGEAANAADGLKLFRRVKPAIVTLDLVMPVTDDVDAISALRAMKKEAPHAVIIVVSTLGSEMNVRQCIQEGAFDYIIKPLSSAVFQHPLKKLQRRFPELRVRA